MLKAYIDDALTMSPILGACSDQGISQAFISGYSSRRTHHNVELERGEGLQAISN